MTKRRSIVWLPAIFLTIVSTAIAAQAQGYVHNFRDVKAPGAVQTDTYAVNQSGVIAGDYVDANNVQHGMILNGTRLISFDLQGCQTTGNTAGSIAAFGINNAGTVAGWCVNTTTGLPIAFTYANGQFTNIAFPKAAGTEANGISDKGEVVGAFFDASGRQHGFYLIGSTYTAIDIPNAGSTTAWGVNKAGLITLFGPNSTGKFISFTFDGKNFKRYSVPGAGPLGTVIQTPNNNGDIVLTWYDFNNAPHGAWFHKLTYIKFSDPKGANSTRAAGLSDMLVVGQFKGQVEIVGRYSPGSLDLSTPTTNAGFAAYGCCRGDSPR
jgi:probable HAF family extracellular repeat protein